MCAHAGSRRTVIFHLGTNRRSIRDQAPPARNDAPRFRAACRSIHRESLAPIQPGTILAHPQPAEIIELTDQATPLTSLSVGSTTSPQRRHVSLLPPRSASSRDLSLLCFSLALPPQPPTAIASRSLHRPRDAAPTSRSIRGQGLRPPSPASAFAPPLSLIHI